MNWYRTILVIALGVTGLPPASVWDPAQGQRAAGVSSALPWLSLDTLSPTRNRPLFAPDRRPLMPPPPPAQLTGEPQKYEPPSKAVPTLRGIIVHPTFTLVVLQDRATRESVVLRSGENFGRWRVTAQSNHTVQLASGSEQIELDLFDDNQDGG